MRVPMAFERENTVEALKTFISAGSYTPGDRLPPERVLIGDLGVSRSELRKALDALEREGAIWRHVGKGTFVASRDTQVSNGTLVEISRQLTPVRMMRARLCIEPAIAREAAINASSEAINRIRLAQSRAADAPDWDSYETSDDQFHRAIAEASDNILLVSLFDQLNQVRRAVAWGNVIRSSERPPRNHSSFDEHDQIATEIEKRNPAAAHEVMRRHIGSVSARLFGEV